MLPTPDLTTDLNTAPTTTKQSKKGISKAHKPNVAQYLISKTFVTDPTIATMPRSGSHLDKSRVIGLVLVLNCCDHSGNYNVLTFSLSVTTSS